MKKRALVLLFLICMPAFSTDMQTAFEFYTAGDYKKAISAVNKIEKNGEKSASLSLLKFQILNKAGKFKEAKPALYDAVKFDPECFEAYLALSKISIEEKNPQDAKKYFQKALDVNPNLSNSPDTLYYFAQICILDKDFKSAYGNILAAIEFEPDEKTYYLELGKIYLYQNDFLKAVNAFEYALGTDVALNAECYNYIGLSNYKRGNYKAALENFERAVTLRPGIIYLYNLAQCYRTLNDKLNYEKTVSLLNSKTPASVEDFLQLSQIAADRGDFGGAIQILKKGIENYPDSPVLNEAFKKLNKS